MIAVSTGALVNSSKLSVQSITLNRYYSKSKSTKHNREYLSDSDSGSDSDDEKRPKVCLFIQNLFIKLYMIFRQQGESEFWRRKMRTLHSLLDVNNDGVISYDDFQMLARNFAALGHLTPKAQEEFNDVLKTIWETQWGEISPYNLINAEQYLTEMQHAVNDKGLREKIHTFLPFLFKVTEKRISLN